MNSIAAGSVAIIVANSVEIAKAVQIIAFGATPDILKRLQTVNNAPLHVEHVLLLLLYARLV